MVSEISQISMAALATGDVSKERCKKAGEIAHHSWED